MSLDHAKVADLSRQLAEVRNAASAARAFADSIRCRPGADVVVTVSVLEERKPYQELRDLKRVERKLQVIEGGPWASSTRFGAGMEMIALGVKKAVSGQADALDRRAAAIEAELRSVTMA